MCGGVKRFFLRLGGRFFFGSRHTLGAKRAGEVCVCVCGVCRQQKTQWIINNTQVDVRCVCVVMCLCVDVDE